MSATRRILHVLHGYFPECGGGVESYVRGLLGPQRRLGLEPMLLHGSFEPRPEPCVEKRDDLDLPAFRLHRSDAYFDYWDRSHEERAGELVHGMIRQLQPDLVHVHQWIRLTDDLVGIAEDCGAATLATLHDLYLSCPACFRLRPGDEHCERELSFESCRDCVPLRGPEAERDVRLGVELYRENSRNEILRARRVLAATHATANLVCSGLGIDPARIDILPLGYEPRFAPGEVPPYELPGEDEPVRVAYWGNITHRKGCQVLLGALRELARERKREGRIELTLFGGIDTKELHEELHGLAEGLPVRFAGPYEYAEIAQLRPHLAVFPSTCFETYGFVLDEAFELGLPALVTDVGAFRERLGGAGFLVPPNEVEPLARTLGEILDRPTLLLEKQARVPEASLTLEAHAAELARHYEEAIATPPREALRIPTSRRLELAQARLFSASSGPPVRRGL